MFRLKTAYAVFIPASIITFGALYYLRMVPYASINFVLLLIAPAAYVYDEAFTYLMAGLSWLILLPVLVFLFRIDTVNAVLPVLIFSMIQAVFIWYKVIFHRENRRRVAELKKRQARSDALREDRDRALRFENGIKTKELSIVNLYDITRKMSEHLKFDEIFHAFSAFLKDYFDFRKCDLIILSRDGEKQRIDREYTVWKEEPRDLGGMQADHAKLISLFADRFRDVFISESDKAGQLKDLGIDNGAVKTLAVIPLLSERKMVGILSVENLPKADLERFAILSIQFALEIKKVLLYEMVEKMAITDSLTGLYVRRYFYERLSEELMRSKRHGFNLALLMIDIDDFKRCNDTYGHLVGDAVLKEMARIISENVREIDIVARYGGEEMSIVLPETAAEKAFVAAERLRKRIDENVFKAYDEKLNLTVSIGVAIYPQDGADIDSIIEKSDQALYAAKKSGKNLVRAYKKEYNS